MINKYKDYFKKQYKAHVSVNDIDLYRKWFFAQWKFLTKKVSFQKSPSILEIGSGLGILYSFLKDNDIAKKYNGLELDNSICQFTNDHFNVESFQNIAFEEFRTKDLYTHIFAFEVLEHLDNPIVSIEKVYSLLEKNGVFIGTSPFPYPKNIYADKTHRYVLHPTNWKKVFMDSGFTSVQTYPLSYIPYIWRINKYLNLRIPLYIPYPYFISTSLIIAKK